MVMASQYARAFSTSHELTPEEAISGFARSISVYENTSSSQNDKEVQTGAGVHVEVEESRIERRGRHRVQRAPDAGHGPMEVAGGTYEKGSSRIRALPFDPIMLAVRVNSSTKLEQQGLTAPGELHGTWDMVTLEAKLKRLQRRQERQKRRQDQRQQLFQAQAVKADRKLAGVKNRVQSGPEAVREGSSRFPACKETREKSIISVELLSRGVLERVRSWLHDARETLKEQHHDVNSAHPNGVALASEAGFVDSPAQMPEFTLRSTTGELPQKNFKVVNFTVLSPLESESADNKSSGENVPMECLVVPEQSDAELAATLSPPKAGISSLRRYSSLGPEAFGKRHSLAPLRCLKEEEVFVDNSSSSLLHLAGSLHLDNLSDRELSMLICSAPSSPRKGEGQTSSGEGAEEKERHVSIVVTSKSETGTMKIKRSRSLSFSEWNKRYINRPSQYASHLPVKQAHHGNRCLAQRRKLRREPSWRLSFSEWIMSADPKLA